MARAEEIVQGKCFICHGVDGESSSPVFPRLAGQHARYVERQLADYKSGKRTSSTMQPMVEDLTPADFKALGMYFEARSRGTTWSTTRSWRRWAASSSCAATPTRAWRACAGCHGAKGGGTETLPRLAGQHAQYTENQLKAFNKRERTNDNAVMHAHRQQADRAGAEGRGVPTSAGWTEAEPAAAYHGARAQSAQMFSAQDSA